MSTPTSPTDLHVDEEKKMPATAEANASVFDEIEPIYFSSKDFDATGHELSKMMGEELELDHLELERFKLKKQLRVVTQKVSALITKNSVAFADHVQRYEVVRNESTDVVQQIRKIRKVLQAERDAAKTSLSIVARDHQQYRLLKLKETLDTLRTMHETGYRLKELMQRGDFPSAIQLCVEAKNAADSNSFYDSAKDISENLSKKLASMESYIDDALASMTVVFNTDRYSFIHSAYQMLGKTQSAAQKLKTFFHATIDSSARTVVIELLNRTTDLKECEKMSYEELCEAIPLEFALECVQEMGLVLCKILCIYHSILKYHIEEDERALTGLVVNDNVVDWDGPQIVEKGIFQIALIDGLHGVFQTAASKYNTLLGLQPLYKLKIDNFIQIIEMTNRFRRFGRVHFNNSFGDLSPTLDQQMKRFFAQYHRERIEELRMFLENEAFTLCPVPLQFTLFDLPEFQFLKESSDAFDEEEKDANRRFREAAELNDKLNVIESNMQNPFLPNVKQPDETKIVNSSRQNGSVSRSSSEESCYETKNENDPEIEDSLPNVCNAALNLLKLFGRYIRMTSVLHSISEQVIASIIEIFDYFLYLIYEFFSHDLDKTQFEIQFTSSRLSDAITSIKSRLITEQTNGVEENGVDTAPRYQTCNPSSSIQLNNLDTLFSLAERVIAVESVIFLTKQLELLRPVLESLLPASKKSIVLLNFYKNILGASFDMRNAIYGCVASRSLHFGQFIKQVSQTNWDIKELQSEHSEYVNSIVKELYDFNNRLTKVRELAHISPDIRSVIWTQVTVCIFRALVYAYGDSGKKCTTEGRALMLLDFGQLSRELEMISGLKPLPQRSFVEDYIKAYYLPEGMHNSWAEQHPEYTPAQIATLLAHVSKKSKSRIFGKVFEGKDSST